MRNHQLGIAVEFVGPALFAVWNPLGGPHLGVMSKRRLIPRPPATVAVEVEIQHQITAGRQIGVDCGGINFQTNRQPRRHVHRSQQSFHPQRFRQDLSRKRFPLLRVRKPNTVAQ